MVEIGEWLTKVLPYASGCADFTIEQEVREACIEFCLRTKVWQEVQPLIYTTPGQQDYDFPPVGSAQVVSVLDAYAAGRPLDIVSMDELIGTEWMERQGHPRMLSQLEVSKFILAPIPVEAEAIALRVAYAPMQDATEVPDVLWQQHQSHITEGAVARLLMQPGKTYTNPDLAVAFAARFEARIAATATRVALAFGRGRIRTKPRMF